MSRQRMSFLLPDTAFPKSSFSITGIWRGPVHCLPSSFFNDRAVLPDFFSQALLFFSPVCFAPYLEFSPFADKNGRVGYLRMLNQFFCQHNPAGTVKCKSLGIAENKIGQIVLRFGKKVRAVFNVSSQFLQKVFCTTFNTRRC